MYYFNFLTIDWYLWGRKQFHTVCNISLKKWNNQYSYLRIFDFLKYTRLRYGVRTWLKSFFEHFNCAKFMIMQNLWEGQISSTKPNWWISKRHDLWTMKTLQRNSHSNYRGFKITTYLDSLREKSCLNLYFIMKIVWEFCHFVHFFESIFDIKFSQDLWLYVLFQFNLDLSTLTFSWMEIQISRYLYTSVSSLIRHLIP